MTGEGRLATFGRHRSVLFSIAYRMLGSVTDAEDILQETFIRWQQTPETEIQSPRAFLVTITSRLCINFLQSARNRRETYVGQWLPEPLQTPVETDEAVDESLSMAFLVMLQRLSPAERIVFLLREVLDYSYAQIAQTVDQTEVNCRQIFGRAKQRVRASRSRFEPSMRLREEVLKQFLSVVAGGELQPLLALLSEDVVLYSDGGDKGPALPVPIFGADKVARGLIGARRKFVPKTLVTHLVSLNGQPAAVSFLEGRPYSVVLLEMDNERIRALYILSNPDKLRHLAPSPAV